MSPNSSKDRSSQIGPTPEVVKTTKIESKNAVKDTVPVVSEAEVDGTSIAREKQEASYVGWKQVGGWEEKDELTPEDLLVDLSKDTYVGNLLPEKLYGE